MPKRCSSILALIALAGCAEPAPVPPEGPTAADPGEPPSEPAVVRAAAPRYLTLARIEGHGDPETGELWMRAIPKAPAVREGRNGVRGLSQALSGYCELDVEADGTVGQNPPGTFEFYTVGEVTGASEHQSSFDPMTCFDRLPEPLRTGPLGPLHTGMFNTLGVGCALQHVGNFTDVDFSRVLLDVDVFNGAAALHAPYGPPFTTGTVPTPLGRNAPEDDLGLWDFGPVNAGESAEMWLYFKNGDTTNFNWTGYLLGEVFEECGNAVDEDCDGVLDNGCHTQGEGDGCYADDDCEDGLQCVDELIVSRLGQGGGTLADDVPGTCRPRCPRGRAGPDCSALVVGSGAEHACAITRIGTVKCWGGAGSGTLAHPRAITAPHLNVGGPAVSALAAGAYTNCAILETGDLRCWGSNTSYVALGNEGPDIYVGPNLEPPPSLDIGGPAAQVAVGDSHACVLRQDGGVRCWGRNAEGQGGMGHTVSPLSLPGGDVPLDRPAMQVCVGARHSCALLDDGHVRCWGDNSAGQLGYGHTDNIGDDESVTAVNPAAVMNHDEFIAGRSVESIACGGNVSCVIFDDGSLRCFGDNAQGALGYGHTDNIGDNEPPFAAGFVATGAKVEQVTTADSVTCALLASGDIKCWGWTLRYPGGCLGHGGTCGEVVSAPPVTPIALGGPALQLGSRTSSATLCAAMADDAVKCWSGNQQNACGLDTAENPIDPPAAQYTLPPDDAGTPCTTDADCAPWNACDASGQCMHKGELRIVLTWSDDTDMDLHIHTPGDGELSATTYRRGGGGLLDFIDDGSDTGAGLHLEHAVFWVPGDGTFELWVQGGPGNTGGDFEIRVYEKDALMMVAADTLGSGEGVQSNHVQYDFPTPIVLGQPNWNANGPGLSATAMSSPQGVALDPMTRKLFVADSGNNRVLRFASVDALTTGAAAEAVLGQSDFVSNSAATSATGMSAPTGLFVDGLGRLWVADTGNSRVLRFDSASTLPSGAPADAVLGQADFTSVDYTLSAARMSAPSGVFVSGGRLWVADTGNNRVLRFDNAFLLANGASAHGVLGQPSFSYSIPGSGASGMDEPYAVAVDGQNRLWVSDTGNHRVLRFESAHLKPNGAAADGVLGQPDFTSNAPGVSAGALASPTGLSCTIFDAVLVSDGDNHRGIAWESPFWATNGADAQHVLGQPDFDSNAPGGGKFGLTMPKHVLYDNLADVIWVADQANNRVKGYSVR